MESEFAEWFFDFFGICDDVSALFRRFFNSLDPKYHTHFFFRRHGESRCCGHSNKCEEKKKTHQASQDMKEYTPSLSQLFCQKQLPDIKRINHPGRLKIRQLPSETHRDGFLSGHDSCSGKCRNFHSDGISTRIDIFHDQFITT